MRAVRLRAILNNVNAVSRSPRAYGGHVAGPTRNVHRYARLGARCANGFHAGNGHVAAVGFNISEDWLGARNHRAHGACNITARAHDHFIARANVQHSKRGV